jgi:hypothetical protein
MFVLLRVLQEDKSQEDAEKAPINRPLSKRHGLPVETTCNVPKLAKHLRLSSFEKNA